jgi:hypothetical protein
MFKQFSTLVNGNEVYLISSLSIFVLFFVLVGVFLFMMKKDEVRYMSELPLNDKES